jgi:hypothetical protein
MRPSPLLVRVATAAVLLSRCPAAAGELALARSASGYLTVVVAIGNVRMSLALDTGSSQTMIAAEHAARLGLVARERLGVVDARGELVEGLGSGPVPLALAEGRELLLPQVVWIPGRSRLLPRGDDLDGLLGADLLAAHDVWIDAAGERMRLGAPGELAAWFDGAELPLASIGGRPAIDVELLDVGRRPLVVRLVIDSGAEAVVLFGAAAERLAAARRGAGLARAVTLSTAHGAAASDAAPVGRARSGGVRLRRGHAALLPAVRHRAEDGLVPLDRLGPVLLELAGGRAVLEARPRDASTHRPDLVAHLPATDER